MSQQTWKRKREKHLMMQKVLNVVMLLFHNWNHFMFLAIMDLETATFTVVFSPHFCIIQSNVYRKYEVWGKSGLNGWCWGLFLVECTDFQMVFLYERGWFWWWPIKMQFLNNILSHFDHKSVWIESIVQTKWNGCVYGLEHGPVQLDRHLGGWWGSCCYGYVGVSSCAAILSLHLKCLCLTRHSGQAPSHSHTGKQEQQCFESHWNTLSGNVNTVFCNSG